MYAMDCSMIKNILYATDLSVYNTYLLRNAYQLALKEDAKITVVHAVEPLGVFADAVIDAYVQPEIVPHIRSEGMPALMSSIREQVIESIKMELSDADLDLSRIKDIVIDRGDPTEVILSTARKLDIDLIIMGSSGHSCSTYPMLGSVVGKVLQLSKCPVLMVPTSKARVDNEQVRKKLAGF